MSRSAEAMFSLESEELTHFGRHLLQKSNMAESHLRIERHVHGRRDGRGLEISLLGFPEVSRAKLKEYLTEAGVAYWESDSQAKARADILAPINILKEEFEHVETGLRTWPVCCFMAETFVKHPEMVPEGPVLELGSGLGMLGCVLRDFLPWSHPVVLTEIQNEEFCHVLNFLKANANLNQRPQKPLVAEELWWGASYVDSFKARLVQNHGIDVDSFGGFTCIIGCDLIYHECAPALLESIDLLLSHDPSAVAYITYPDRAGSSVDEFTAKLETMSFNAKELSFAKLCGGLDAEDTQKFASRKRWLGDIVFELGLHILAIRRTSSTSK